jgi:hypothetical protein
MHRPILASLGAVAGALAIVAVAVGQSGGAPDDDLKPLRASVGSDLGIARIAPASFCGEPRHGGLDLACGGEARAPRRSLRVEPGAAVQIAFAEPVQGVEARFERVLRSGAVQRLTHDRPVRPRRGTFTVTAPTPMPAGLVLAVSVRYRDVVYVPGLSRSSGAVDGAQAEFGVRLNPPRR